MEKTRKPKRKSVITSFRLTPDAITLLKKLSTQTGLSRSGVLEVAIRDLARFESDFEDADLLKQTRKPRNKEATS